MLRVLGLIVLVLGALAGQAGDAFAAPQTISVAGPGLIFSDTDGDADDFDIGYDSTTNEFVVTDRGGTVSNGAGCSAPPIRCGATGVSFVLVVLGDGADNFSGTNTPHTISVVGGAGADTLTGGAGRDFLTPGLGKDSVAGGAGFDVVSYADRAAAVVVVLGGTAGNGEAGEDDTVAADVEDAQGGSGPDQLTGDGNQNELTGNGGGDTLTGGGGGDILHAGSGDDVVKARDGVADVIECDADNDTAEVDTLDSLANCETVNSSSELEADADHDGAPKPSDCNDANTAIRPGRTDVPDNGVDENCDGTDAARPDRDGDGVDRPLDCDDSNPAVKPGAKEIAGNGLDDDCDGRSVALPLMVAPISNLWAFRGQFTINRLLVVSDVPGGTRIEVRCFGKKCPFKLKTRTVKRKTKRVSLSRLLARKRLYPNVKIEVKLLNPRFLGKVVRYTTRKRRSPNVRSLCIKVGRSPIEC